MPNWFESMQQTFEYYIVDPKTWMDTKRLTNIKSCSITRDSTVETLGSQPSTSKKLLVRITSEHISLQFKMELLRKPH